MTPISHVDGIPALRKSRSILAGMLLAACLAGAAMAQAPSPAQLAAAKDVVIMSGISRAFDQFVPGFAQQISQTFTKTRPEIADDLALVLQQLQPEFKAREDVLIDRAARIFAANMSEQELKDTAAFFNSESGKKYVAAQPAILNQMVGDVNAWSKTLSSDMMDRVRAEMKKKGHEL